MNYIASSYRAPSAFLRGLLWLAVAGVAQVSLAADQATTQAPPAAQSSSAQLQRSGGMLEGSYNYHRQPAMQPTQPASAPPNSARSGGWYHYGFPVESYRWGYFGAERNYPRVIWHTGWYGDCVRTAYRYGN